MSWLYLTMSYPKNMAESSVLWYSEKRRIVIVEKNELTSYMNVTLLLHSYFVVE